MDDMRPVEVVGKYVLVNIYGKSLLLRILHLGNAYL